MGGRRRWHIRFAGAPQVRADHPPADLRRSNARTVSTLSRETALTPRRGYPGQTGALLDLALRVAAARKTSSPARRRTTAVINPAEDRRAEKADLRPLINVNRRTGWSADTNRPTPQLWLRGDPRRQLRGAPRRPAPIIAAPESAGQAWNETAPRRGLNSNAGDRPNPAPRPRQARRWEDDRQILMGKWLKMLRWLPVLTHITG